MENKERKTTKGKSSKSWREKMENPQEREIVPIPQKGRKQHGHRTMLVPRPLDLDSFIRKIPSGKLITFPQLRNRLAFTLGADSCCPFTSGNFLRISAKTAEEDLVRGRVPLEGVTYDWRVGSKMAPFSKGPPREESFKRRLEGEGFKLEKDKGGKFRELDFKKFLPHFYFL